MLENALWIAAKYAAEVPEVKIDSPDSHFNEYRVHSLSTELECLGETLFRIEWLIIQAIEKELDTNEYFLYSQERNNNIAAIDQSLKRLVALSADYTVVQQAFWAGVDELKVSSEGRDLELYKIGQSMVLAWNTGVSLASEENETAE